MSDLVKRLRSVRENGCNPYAHCREAADRIEELEAALRQGQKVMAMMIDPGMIEQTSTMTAWAQCKEAEAIARAALNKKG